MAAHIGECKDYKELYRTSPEKALSPAEEQKRYLAEGGAEEAKLVQAEARADRASAHRGMNDKKLEMEHERWKLVTTQASTSRAVTTPEDGTAWGVHRDEVVPESLADLGKRVAALRFNQDM
jgi:hypothetical protein